MVFLVNRQLILVQDSVIQEPRIHPFFGFTILKGLKDLCIQLVDGKNKYTNMEDNSWKVFKGSALKMIRITSTHINVVTRAHQS